MSAYRIFPSLIPETERYTRKELLNSTAAHILQGAAAAHTTSKVNGQSSALEIADFLSGNHTKSEVDGILKLVKDSDPPRSEVDLSPALNQDGNLSQYS